MGIVVPHTSDGVTVTDLLSKRIAVNEGSNVHWLLLQMLEEVEIALDEIKMVYTPPKYPLTARDLLVADAWMIWDPLLSVVESNPDLRILANDEERVRNHPFYQEAANNCLAFMRQALSVNRCEYVMLSGNLCQSAPFNVDGK